MKKKRGYKIEWNVRDEKICWAATIMILALLIVILSSCKTHRESRTDFEITTTESYQEHRTEGIGRQMAVKTVESRDTLRETGSGNGQIEIERDTAGRAVRIIYEYFFDGLRSEGITLRDTVFRQEVIVIRDSIGDGKTDLKAEGQIKEKKDYGVNTGALVGMGLVWLVICALVVFIFLRANKYVNRWNE